MRGFASARLGILLVLIIAMLCFAVTVGALLYFAFALAAGRRAAIVAWGLVSAAVLALDWVAISAILHGPF